MRVICVDLQLLILGTVVTNIMSYENLCLMLSNYTNAFMVLTFLPPHS